MPTDAEYSQGQAVERKERMSDRPRGRARRSLSHLRQIGSSRRARGLVTVGFAAAGCLLLALAARHVSHAPMPFSRGEPTLLLSVALLFLVAFLLKACGWRRLFAVPERPGAFAVVGVTGILAAAALIALPFVARSPRLLRYRLARWLAPRATPPRRAAEAWALVSGSWLMRAAALALLLAALGLGFNFPLALMLLCTGAAAAALPVSPAGAATQIGAGATLLIVSGIGRSEAVGFALAAQTLIVLAGASVLLLSIAWATSRRLAGAAALRFR